MAIKKFGKIDFFLQRARKKKELFIQIIKQKDWANKCFTQIYSKLRF